MTGEAIYGELKGGILVDISLGLSRWLNKEGERVFK